MVSCVLCKRLMLRGAKGKDGITVSTWHHHHAAPHRILRSRQKSRARGGIRALGAGKRKLLPFLRFLPSAWRWSSGSNSYLAVSSSSSSPPVGSNLRGNRVPWAPQPGRSAGRWVLSYSVSLFLAGPCWYFQPVSVRACNKTCILAFFLMCHWGSLGFAKIRVWIVGEHGRVPWLYHVIVFPWLLYFLVWWYIFIRFWIWKQKLCEKIRSWWSCVAWSSASLVSACQIAPD